MSDRGDHGASGRTDGIDRERWDRSHKGLSPTLARIKRETICALLPIDVEPTTLWPSLPLPKIGAALGLSPGDHMVDLGCGRGEVGLWIARSLDVGWTGVDPSPVGVALAAELARRNYGRPVSAVEGHFLATGLPDRSADAVLVLDALHFTPDLPKSLAEIRRIGRPGSILVIVGPQMTDPRPAISAAGFTLERDEETSGWREVMEEFLGRAHEEADTLRAEMGDQATEEILNRRVEHLEGIWHGLIAARAPGR